jgi:NADH-quinone oxidoreductase subunit M
MLDSLPILSLIVFAPLLGVLVLIFVPQQKGRWIQWIGIAASLLPLLLAVWLYVDFDHLTGEMQYEESVRWIQVPLNQESPVLQPFAGYEYVFDYKMAVDGLSLPLVLLTALVSFMAALASVHIKKRWKTFYILFLLLETGMLGVFLARDLFLFFIFFEITLVPAYFLIGIWGYRDRERAANKFLLYNGIGSAVMLIAFLIIVSTAGMAVTELPDGGTKITYSGDIRVITENLHNPGSFANMGENMFPDNPFYVSPALKWALFIMLLAAFGIKLPIFPFHTWMLKVHAEAPPPLVMLHSGVMLKMGAYGLIRFGVMFFPDQAREWAFVLAVLGLVNILYGAVLAFVQKDFKLILAYSSVSHMGIVLFGIAALNQAGLKGAVFQLVSHGLISALMFLLVGSIYARTQTTEIDKLGGLAKSIPFMSGILLTAGLASLGLPGLSGFISEFLSFLGLFAEFPAVAAIGAAGIVLTAAYVLRGVMRITFGPMPDRYARITDARLVEVIPMITLVAFILLIGIYPAVLSEPMQETIQSIVVKMGG